MPPLGPSCGMGRKGIKGLFGVGEGGLVGERCVAVCNLWWVILPKPFLGKLLAGGKAGGALAAGYCFFF